MQIYALALEKGGVGKTCLAVNLAAAFSRLNLRVLVIDLDAQAHATHWLGIASTSVRPEDSVLGVLGGRALLDCVRQTDEGVDVLPAHSSLASLPVQLATAPNSGLFVLQDALGQLTRSTSHYDIVVCDLALAAAAAENAPGGPPPRRAGIDGPIIARLVARAQRTGSPLAAVAATPTPRWLPPLHEQLVRANQGVQRAIGRVDALGPADTETLLGDIGVLLTNLASLMAQIHGEGDIGGEEPSHTRSVPA